MYLYIYTYIHMGILASDDLTWLWNISMLSMGKSTISMAMFNSYVQLPEGT